MKRLFLKAGFVAVASGLLKACGGGGGGGGGSTPSGSQTLLELAQRDSRFSHLASAAEKAGLTGELGRAGTLTLFAPTNAAFDALASRIGLGDGNGLINALTQSQLDGLLRFHLLPRILNRDDLVARGNAGGERPDTLYTFNGEPAQLIFVNENNQLNLWDASGRTAITLADTDIAAANGVLHVVNEVLVPRGVFTVSQMVRSNNQYFSEFSAAMTQAVIQEIDGGNFTLFVPQDGSTSVALTTKVVRHHMVRGITSAAAFPPGGAALNFTTLIGQTTRLTPGTTADASQGILARMSDATGTPAIVVDVEFNATNGIIHTINKRLVPTGGA